MSVNLILPGGGARSVATDSPKHFFKYTTACTAVKILTSGSLRAQSPFGFNDPFDVQWDLYGALRSPDGIREYRALLEDILLGKEPLPESAHPEFRQAIERERKTILCLPEAARPNAIATITHGIGSRSPVSERTVRILNDMRYRMRVLCFSETGTCRLMWAHYADNHCGVVLVFTASGLQQDLPEPVEPVRYVIDPPVAYEPRSIWRKALLGNGLEPSIEEVYRTMVLSKRVEWESEREWRSVWTETHNTHSEYTYTTFSSLTLAGVILGLRMDLGKLQTVRRIISEKYLHTSVSRISVNQGTFELVPVGLSQNSFVS